MILRRVFLLVMLALGLLLLPGAAAAERIERSTDQQGTIHIGNTGPASQGITGEVSAPPGPVAPEQGPPGISRRSTRRPYGPEAEARRRAILERRQSLSAAPEAPAPPAPVEPPLPPEPPQE